MARAVVAMTGPYWAALPVHVSGQADANMDVGMYVPLSDSQVTLSSAGGAAYMYRAPPPPDHAVFDVKVELEISMDGWIKDFV